METSCSVAGLEAMTGYVVVAAVDPENETYGHSCEWLRCGEVVFQQ